MQWTSYQLQYWLRNRRCAEWDFRRADSTNKLTSLHRSQKKLWVTGRKGLSKLASRRPIPPITNKLARAGGSALPLSMLHLLWRDAEERLRNVVYSIPQGRRWQACRWSGARTYGPLGDPWGINLAYFLISPNKNFSSFEGFPGAQKAPSITPGDCSLMPIKSSWMSYARKSKVGLDGVGIEARQEIGMVTSVRTG